MYHICLETGPVPCLQIQNMWTEDRLVSLISYIIVLRFKITINIARRYYCKPKPVPDVCSESLYCIEIQHNNQGS